MLNDERLARRAAEAAGEVLLALRASSTLSGRALGEAGDALAQAAIADLLQRERPDDAVLSEEAADDAARLRASRVWIVDPLDGTREYGEPPRTDWAVHVALWSRGELVAGAVACPARGQVFGTDAPPAAPLPRPGRLRLAVSRSRPPDFVAEVGRLLDAELVPMGSAGIKAMAVVTGEVDAYVHANGQYEWDSAAPVAVARSAGLHASRLDGSELVYNEADPCLPDLVICRPQIAQALLAAVGSVMWQGDPV